MWVCSGFLEFIYFLAVLIIATDVLRICYPVMIPFLISRWLKRLTALQDASSVSSLVSFELLQMFADKSLMTVADAAGVVGEAPMGHVRLNGVLYKLPDNFPAEVAKSICMIEVDTKNLSSVHVPQFRLEAQLGIAPKVYSQFQDVTLKAGLGSQWQCFDDG